jgi:hypothetical protein
MNASGHCLFIRLEQETVREAFRARLGITELEDDMSRELSLHVVVSTSPGNHSEFAQRPRIVAKMPIDAGQMGLRGRTIERVPRPDAAELSFQLTF